MNLELTETVSPLKSVLLVPCVVYLATVNMDSEISPKRRGGRGTPRALRRCGEDAFELFTAEARATGAEKNVALIS